MNQPPKTRIEKADMTHTRQNNMSIVLTLVIAVMQVFIAPALSANLLTHEQADAAGWFPDPEVLV